MKTLLKFSLLSFYITFSQVGIGTTSPKAALDMSNSNDGFLITKISLDETNLSDYQSMLRYDSTSGSPENGLLVYNTNSTAPLTEGFYYWNGTSWSEMSNSWDFGGASIGNSGGRNFERLNKASINQAPTNFLGTNNDEDLVFIRNNEEVLRLSDGESYFDASSGSNRLRVTKDRYGLQYGHYNNNSSTAMEASFFCDVEIGGGVISFGTSSSTYDHEKNKYAQYDSNTYFYDGSSELLTIRGASEKYQFQVENVATPSGGNDFSLVDRENSDFYITSTSNGTTKSDYLFLIDNDRKAVKINEILNIKPRTSDPSTPENGDIYLYNDGTTRELRVYDSGTTTWYPL